MQLFVRLALDERADPPCAALVVEHEGQEIARRDVVPAAEWLGVLDAVAEAIDHPLRDTLASGLTTALTRLRDTIAAEDARQDARRDALAQWAPVAGLDPEA